MGTLTLVSSAAASGNYVISTLGTKDWAALDASQVFNKKSGGPSSIAFANAGGASSLSTATVSWTGGTPTASQSANNQGDYSYNTSAPLLTATVTVGTTVDDVYVLCGGGSDLHWSISLSDGSATTLTGSKGAAGDYLLHIQAGANSAGQTLSVAVDGVSNYAYIIAVWTVAGSSGVTAALTGVSATGAVGSVIANDTRAATGNQAIGSAGSVTAAISKALTGNAATGAVGALGANVSTALTGVVGTGATGNVVANVSVGLTGVQATGSVGTVTPGTGVSVALSGVSATGSAGNVSAAVDTALTGLAASGSAGSVTANVSPALTGNPAIGSVGVLSAAVSAGLSGTQGTGQVGSVSVSGDITLALTGVQAQGSVGNVGLPSGGGGYDYPKKRRFIQRVGNKIVVYTSATSAINSIQRDEEKGEPVQELKEAPKPTAPVKPELVVSLPEVKKLAEPNELPIVQAWIKAAQYEALLNWFERKREEEDEEALLLLL